MAANARYSPSTSESRPPHSSQATDIAGITASSHQRQEAGHLGNAAIRLPNRRWAADQTMPYFKVILSGRGIDLPFEGHSIIGFFTTRLVRSADPASAESLAKDLVLSEWLPGGTYAKVNHGSPPTLSVEQSFPVGWLAGTFGRKPSGYTFYRHEG